MTNPQLLTHSYGKSYRGCPRQAYYAYHLGVRPRVAARALRFGTLFHVALEAYWRARMEGGDAQARLVAALAALRARLFEMNDPYAEQMLEVLVAAYCALWSLRELTVLAVEVQFRAPLFDTRTGSAVRGWQLGGKIDLIVRLPDGRVAVVEHKSSSEDISPGSQYIERLILDGQIDQYIIGGGSLGYDIALVIYDVVQKPKLQPLLATPEENRKYKKKTGELHANQRERDETPEEYGDRLTAKVMSAPREYVRQVDIARLDTQSSNYEKTLFAWAKRIGDSIESGDIEEWPMNTDNCFRHHAPCAYWPVCSGRARIDDELQYEVVGAHVELREDEQQEQG